tara:strand:+ start:210 stop:539 length:330 start_codon:yes stop_codon:yes gene_type:complete
MIEITEPAADKIKEYRSKDLNNFGKSLRIKVVGGGCSGLRYELAFDNSINKDSDFIEEAHGVKVIIDEKSALYMLGTELDFVDSLMESGFKINNPNATNSCGCGESFGV